MHRAPSSPVKKMRCGMGIDSRQGKPALNIVECCECGISSGAFWIRWRAYRIDDPELGEPPALAFYCPACADREFGPRRRNRL
jgi:hypothetical protein